MSAKQILLKQLAEDDMKKVLAGFFFLAEKYKGAQLRNDAIFQSGRLEALKKQERNDTISPEEYRLETAKIRQALLQIVQDFPDDWTLDGMENAPASFAAVAELLDEKEKQPSQKASTTGDNSPAIITDEGDVTISYGAPEPQKDSTHMPKNPQK